MKTGVTKSEKDRTVCRTGARGGKCVCRLHLLVGVPLTILGEMQVFSDWLWIWALPLLDIGVK